MWYFIFHSKRQRISYLVRRTLAEYWYWSLEGLDNHALPISYTYVSCQVFNNSGNAWFALLELLGGNSIFAFLWRAAEKGARILWHICKLLKQSSISSHVFEFVLLHAVWFWQCCANNSSIEVWHTSWIIFHTLTEPDLLIILGVCIKLLQFLHHPEMCSRDR